MTHFEIEEHFVPELQTKLSFKQVRFHTLGELMSQTCPELISEDYQSKHKKELSKKVFEIEVKSEWQTWNILKRIEEFIALEKTLKGRYGRKVMGIPVRKQSDNENTNLLLQFFELFLQQISKHEEIKQDADYLLFIELPQLLQRRRLRIYKQEFLKKRSGGRHNEATCRRCTSTIFGNWKRRFFTVSSEGIFYSVSNTGEQSQIKQMIPFSFHFSIVYGLRNTGFKYGIILNACQRNLQLIAQDLFSFVIFIYSVKKSLCDNHYLQVNRYGSFACVRENCDGKFYIDGEDYFKDMYEEMIRARKEIFITDWMISPFFMLVRPKGLDSEERLDRVLERVAKRGVKVNIILFLEPKLALNNDSQYAKQYLEALNPNIKVLRHPNYILIPFLWSHHQKIVVIDQKIGFLGGLDICYGRMDNSQHRLSDTSTPKYWQGADYANFRISDIYTPRQYTVSMLDREKVPRMPWHDIAMQIRGDSVIDLTRHFVQYWNFVNFQTKFDDRELLMQAGLTQSAPNYEQKQTIERFREDLRKFQEEEKEHKRKGSGQEEEKEALKSSKRNRSVTDNTLFVMGSNDIRKKAETDQRIDRTISFSINQQIRGLQDITVENEAEKEFYREYLAKQAQNRQEPSLIKNLNDKIAEKMKKLKNLKLNPLELFKNRHALTSEILVEGQAGSKGKQRHQILRSASTWGLGIEEGNEQKSIYNAYIELITQAKSFIYIQNQFFISVQNRISQAISLRIDKAYRNQQPFKVIVILPLLPGFEGQIDNQNSAVLRVQMHLQYQTICRGGASLFQRLSHIPDISHYIQFYCLRTHDKLSNQPVTQIIYVHSKLMIVDDEVVIMGSANINDRSMLGTRDSEIAIVVEDQEELLIQRSQKNVCVKKFAHELRVKLYMEHFAVTKKEAEDFFNEDVWWLINERAKKNTLMYREIFACYPDNEAKDLFEYKVFQKGKKYERYDLLKELIKGNVVEFPTCFMSNERLTLKASQKEFYVPAISFT